MGARNRVGIGLSYRHAKPHSLAELVPWNRFFGLLKNFNKIGLCALTMWLGQEGWWGWLRWPPQSRWSSWWCARPRQRGGRAGSPPSWTRTRPGWMWTSPPPTITQKKSNLCQSATDAALQRKSQLYILRKGIARPQFQFPPSCVCEQFILSQDGSTTTYFPLAE